MNESEKKTLTVRNWEDAKQGVYKDLANLLQKHDHDLTMLLATSVASVCNVEVQQMLSTQRKEPYVQARWLMFYALRYAYNCTYEYIAKMTAFKDCKYTYIAVSNGVEKMAAMIAYEPTWKRRWDIIKHLIKQVQGEENVMPKNQKIVITVPKDIEVEIKKQ